MKTTAIFLFTLLLFSTCTHDDSLKPGNIPDLKSGNLTLSDFQKYLKADMNYNTITSIFGVPSKDTGSGIHIYVYKLADSTEIWIGYANKIIYARHLDGEGSTLDVLI